MSQYKAAMKRMTLPEDVESSNPIEQEPTDEAITTSHPILSWLEKHAAFIMMPCLPLAWCILVIGTLSGDDIRSSWAMPILGMASATLANTIPVGGGIVFVPALSLFGVELKLGAAFAVATMTFGNGVFGFLSWLRKDPSRIAWAVVPTAVVPAWIGAIHGTLHPFLTPSECRCLFGAFALVVGMIVGFAIHRGDGDVAKAFARSEHDQEKEVSVSILSWNGLVASIASFLAGVLLVSHIGIGNALTTFLVSVYIWGLHPKMAIVTGILCGGWTSLVPFLFHLFALRDVPIALWVMGLPGVYLGASVAPRVYELVGIEVVLKGFVAFLIVTALLMFTSLA